jgi:hypothetical protein
VPEQRLRASEMLPGHLQAPMNTGQALNSNRFQSSKSANYKEIRCNAANFNEFLEAGVRVELIAS